MCEGKALSIVDLSLRHTTRWELGRPATWSFWFDNPQPLNRREVFLVETGNPAAPLQRGRCYDDVVILNPLTGGFQFRPEAGMLVGSLFRVRDYG